MKRIRFDPEVRVRTLPEGCKEFNKENNFTRDKNKDSAIADRTRSKSEPAEVPWVLPSDPHRSTQLQNQLSEAHEANKKKHEADTCRIMSMKKIRKRWTQRVWSIKRMRKKWTLGEDPP